MNINSVLIWDLIGKKIYKNTKDYANAIGYPYAYVYDYLNGKKEWPIGIHAVRVKDIQKYLNVSETEAINILKIGDFKEKQI